MKTPHAVSEVFESRKRSLDSLGINDPAWELHDARLLVQALTGTPVAILGGDVYFEQDGKIDTAYDSWHSERDSSESLEQYAVKSQERALEYLNTYRVPEGREVLIGLIMSDEATAGL